MTPATPPSAQTPPNGFEMAILEMIAREHTSLVLDLGSLRVRGRKYTGVGSYTDFVCDELGEPESVHLKAPIAVPGVPNGMGAVLFCREHKPAWLETFTYANDFWTGASEGFSIG